MKFFSHPAITDDKDMRTLYPIAFSVDTKSYLVLSMNSNGQVLEQVVHKHQSCLRDWPKLNCTKVRHRANPICDASVSRPARRSFAPLQTSRRNHRSYPPSTVWFSFQHKSSRCSVNMTLYSHGLEAGGF